MFGSIKSAGRRVGGLLFKTFASERFFWIVLGVFVLQALWFVVTARYPMAFDEDFHFGLIRLHTAQWLPYFTHQPEHADVFGAVARDPSYLYHYLMSFPYRLVGLFTGNMVAQIIILRLLSVALFGVNIVLFRLLLFRLGGSKALTHVALFLFTLVPIVPFLAAQINYDNLFIAVTIIAMLMTFSLMDDLKAERVVASKVIVLLCLLLGGSLVKYAFLPVALAIGCMVLWRWWRSPLGFKTAWGKLYESARRMSRVGLVTLVVIFGLLCWLFIERYGVNLVIYHSPSPDCGQVLSVEECKHYGPWGRDYLLKQTRPQTFHPNVAEYTWEWLDGMLNRSFFAINHEYTNVAQLPVPSWTAVALGVTGVPLFLVFLRTLRRTNHYRLFGLIIAGLYIFILFMTEYSAYAKTAMPVAINGRYLVPFLPVVFLFVGLAFRQVIRSRAAKAYVAALVCLLFLQGGGVLTWIVQSRPNWYWQNPVVIKMSEVAQNVVSPVVYGAYRDDY